MLAARLFVLFFIVGFSNAAPKLTNHVIHEKRHTPASGWIKGARIEADAVLPMRIGLTQSNLDKGQEYLMEVSDPRSNKYGKYWIAEDVHNAFAPSEYTVQAVREWLISFGIRESRIIHSDNKGWLAFDATVDEAERLLLTEFYEHEHKRNSKIGVGCDQYHVPEHLQPHIDYITPGIKYTPVVRRSFKAKRGSPRHYRRSNRIFPSPVPFDNFPLDWKPLAAHDLPEDLQGCGRNITPTCLKALYQIPNATKVTNGNSLGLYEQGDYFDKPDLDLFYKSYAPNVPQGTYPIPALIDGAEYSVPPDVGLVGGEAVIDIDIAYSLIYPQTVTLYQTDDQIYAPEEVATRNLFNTFLDALDGSYCTYSAYGETGNDPTIDPVYPDPHHGGFKGKLQCGVYKPTYVISASYGQAEADLPVNYTKRQCNEFMKLGLQGHSILSASGDYGVASFPGDGAANGCLGPDSTIFNPQYPGNCPYITSVGATMLYPDQTVLEPESVMHVNLTGSRSNFSSSGGFSNYFPQPWYQQDAIANYFASADLTYPYYSELCPNFNTTHGLYNSIGRGYPDIAANGVNLLVFVNTTNGHSFGTSLASPLFASVLVLINEERFAIGKGPVGFVNPALYAFPEVLNDIKNGTTAGCGSQGFQAIPGWDPATGLGTPNYPKLKALFLSLP